MSSSTAHLSYFQFSVPSFQIPRSARASMRCVIPSLHLKLSLHSSVFLTGDAELVGRGLLCSPFTACGSSRKSLGDSTLSSTLYLTLKFPYFFSLTNLKLCTIQEKLRVVEGIQSMKLFLYQDQVELIWGRDYSLQAHYS